MPGRTEQDQLLECLFHVVARAAIRAEEVALVVGEGKQRKAFNLCDGTLRAAEIARRCGIDQGNFSRTVRRWQDHGVLFELGEENERRLLHVYPLPTAEPRRDAKASTRARPARAKRPKPRKAGRRRR